MEEHGHVISWNVLGALRKLARRPEVRAAFEQADVDPFEVEQGDQVEHLVVR